MYSDVTINWVPGITLEEMEKATILQALRFYRGNIAQCAIALGISDKTIRNKLEKYEADGIAKAERDAAYRIEQGRILDRMRGILPGQTANGPPNLQKSLQTDSGIRLEPTTQTPPKHEVSVPKREEVQTMLPKSASAGGSRKNR